MPITPSYQNALDREAAWLNTSVADGLPLLPLSAGGPFALIQARTARVIDGTKPAIYVQRAPARSLHLDRYAAQRTMWTHHFRLLVIWPFLQGTGSAEDSESNLDAAIDLLLQRVAGTQNDKTHGSRFLSITEGPEGITVDAGLAEQAAENGFWKVTVGYSGDDEFNN